MQKLHGTADVLFRKTLYLELQQLKEKKKESTDSMQRQKAGYAKKKKEV